MIDQRKRRKGTAITTLAECTRLSTTERTILRRFAAQAQAALGDHLVSMILFGSHGQSLETLKAPAIIKEAEKEGNDV